jgi:hypothetical protein
MTALGDLLEALYRAGDRPLKAIAEYRFAVDRGINSRAFHLAHDRGGEAPPLVPANELDEWRSRVWVDLPDRVREDREGGTHPHHSVRVGELLRMVSERQGIVEHNVSPGMNDVGEEVVVLLNPWPAVGRLSLQVVGTGERVGRKTLIAHARPRPQPLGGERILTDMAIHRIGSGADEYELEVDAERGALLRAEARLEGRPFRTTEVVAIEFDPEFGADEFAFSPPAGAKAGPLQPYPIHGPVHELAALAPFKTLVPAQVPEEWRLRARYTPGPEDRPGEVVLNYSTPDGTVSVQIREFGASSAAGRPVVEDWEQVSTSHGLASIQRRGQRSGNGVLMTSHLFLVIDETFVDMSSAELDGDALVRLAEALRPAAPEAPVI